MDGSGSEAVDDGAGLNDSDVAGAGEEVGEGSVDSEAESLPAPKRGQKVCSAWFFFYVLSCAHSVSSTFIYPRSCRWFPSNKKPQLSRSVVALGT